MKTFWKVALASFFVVIIVVFAGSVGYLIYKTRGLGNGIMIVPLKGAISLDSCEGGLFSISSCATVDAVKDAFSQAEADPNIKVIVLDVNSGGGSVVASREMMRVVKSSSKPVVTWIGEVGASGAYYVASATDYIVADEDSLTGSIGVIASFMHYYGLMDELGVNVTVIKAGKTKDIGSAYRPMTDEERELMQGKVDKIYSDFTADVAVNRGLDPDYVEDVSNGEIYLGSEALELGLIDAVGGFDEAVSAAKQIGGIEGDASIVYPEREESFLELLNRIYGGFINPGFHNVGYNNINVVSQIG